MAHGNGSTGSSAAETLEILRSRILVDGFHIVMDLDASHDGYLHDSLTQSDFLDFYAFFASQPIGYRHPKMLDPEFQQRLLRAATTKVANADVYTQEYATFVKTFDEVAGIDSLRHFFFIDGGALAVENALKTAFDWKVRKNLAAQRGEIGHQVIHFRRCFHGRSGYTMSMTDTVDPRKTQYFPKFDWPRISNPAVNFALSEPQRTEDVVAREQAALDEIKAAISQHGHDIAAIIIEPIQGEGGDNHFRGEFLKSLRQLADECDILLIFDEVQTGLGITGKTWACQHFDVLPDILVFGKKTQICGIMASARIDEVTDNVFRTPSRINSTWGGNLADMVRSTRYLQIIRDENLIANAAKQGARLLAGLQAFAERHTHVSNVRGRGLMCAFDLPSTELRNKTIGLLQERKMMALPCGESGLRFRPVLDVKAEHIDKGLAILDEALGAVA